MVICFTSEHKPVISQVAATANQTDYWIISSPEPLAHHDPASVRRRPFSNIFFSETAWPIKAKFLMKHFLDGGTNVFINNPGHMTKMAPTPIYGKTLQNHSFPEPLDRFQRNLA